MKGIFLLLLFTLTNFTALAHKEKWDENKKDWSPLMLAIYHGKSDSIKKLIEQNVDVNFITPGINSRWRLTALDVAIFKENENAVETLLSTNKISGPERYLLRACGQKNAKNVQLLINYGANPRDTSENGYSVLARATSFGSFEILECLLKNGANINHDNKIYGFGLTILMYAVLSGEVKKVKLLLDNGADKYVKDQNGNTALYYVDHLKVSEATKSELRQLLK